MDDSAIDAGRRFSRTHDNTMRLVKLPDMTAAGQEEKRTGPEKISVLILVVQQKKHFGSAIKKCGISCKAKLVEETTRNIDEGLIGLIGAQLF